MMEQKAGVNFANGLCTDFIYGELLWEISNPDNTSRSTLYPTWSWASVKDARLRNSTSSRVYSKKSTIHTTAKVTDTPLNPMEDYPLNGLFMCGPILHATLKQDQYGHFRTTHDRLPQYGYKPDSPLPNVIDVACLVIAEWGKDYRGDIDHDKGMPGYAGLILLLDSSMESEIAIPIEERSDSE